MDVSGLSRSPGAGRDALVAAQRLCVHFVALKGTHQEADVCVVVPRFITYSQD